MKKHTILVLLLLFALFIPHSDTLPVEKGSHKKYLPNPSVYNSNGKSSISVSISEDILAKFDPIRNGTSTAFSVDHSGWTSDTISVVFNGITGRDTLETIQSEESSDRTAFFRIASNKVNQYRQPQEISQEIRFDKNTHLNYVILQFQFVDSSVSVSDAKVIGSNTYIELRSDIGGQPSKSGYLARSLLSDAWVINKNQTFDSFCDHVNTFTTLLINASIGYDLVANTSYWIVYNSGNTLPTSDYTYYGLWTYKNTDLSLASANRSYDTIQSGGDAGDIWILIDGWNDLTDLYQDSSYHPYLELGYKVTDILQSDEIGLNITSPMFTEVLSNRARLSNVNSENSTSFTIESSEPIMYNVSVNGTLYRTYKKTINASYTVNPTYVNWTIDLPMDAITDPFFVSGRNISLSLPSEFYEWEIANSSLNDLPQNSHYIRIFANSSNHVAFINVEDRVKRGTQAYITISGVGTQLANITIFNTSGEIIYSEMKRMNEQFSVPIAITHALGTFTIEAFYRYGEEIGYKYRNFYVYDEKKVSVSIKDTDPFTHRNVPNTQVTINNGSNVYIYETNENGDPVVFNAEIGKEYYVNWTIGEKRYSHILYVPDNDSNSFEFIADAPYIFDTDIIIQVYQRDGVTFLPCNVSVNGTMIDAPSGIGNYRGIEGNYNISVIYGKEQVFSSRYEIWRENNTIRIYTDIQTETPYKNITIRMLDALERHIPNLPITISNSSGAIGTEITDEFGECTFLNIHIGTYNISWEQNGEIHVALIEVSDSGIVEVISKQRWVFSVAYSIVVKDTDENGKHRGYQCIVSINGVNKTTNENGEVSFILEEGNYTALVYYNGTLVTSVHISVLKDVNESAIIITPINAHPDIIKREIPLWGWVTIGVVSIMGLAGIGIVEKRHRDRIKMQRRVELWRSYRDLFEDEQNIRAVLLTHNQTASLLTQWSHNLPAIENGGKSDLISGFLDAISNWSGELDRDSPLKEIQWGKFAVYIEYGTFCSMSILSDEPIKSETMKERISFTLKSIEEGNAEELKDFHGNVTPFEFLYRPIVSELGLKHQYEGFVNEFAIHRAPEKIRPYLYEKRNRMIRVSEFVESIKGDFENEDEAYYLLYKSIEENVIQFDFAKNMDDTD